MINLQQAKIDPASIFANPHDVLREHDLSREEKIDILRRWAYDERELAVAEEENMQAKGDAHHNRLQEVSESLLALGANDDEVAPTKQG